VTNIERREFAVVGAGLLGLGASRALSGLGRDVLCLEQAQVGHEWSGSKGNSRAFRYGYDEPMLNAMVAEAERAWRELEAASGYQILQPRPFLNFGAGLAGYAQSTAAAGGAVEYLEADEVAERFPTVAIRGPAVLEPTAAMIRADLARDALRTTMKAELREGVEVTAVRDSAGAVRLETTKGPIEAGRVVICAGPGTAPLLRGMGWPYRVFTALQQVVYLDTGTPPGAAADHWPAVVQRFTAGPAAPDWYTGTAFPDGTGLQGRSDRTAALDDLEDEQLYGLPLPELGMYKFGVRHSGPEVAYRQTSLDPDPAITRQLIAAAATLLRDVGCEPRLVERCVLDYTSDLHFVLDQVGGVVVGAGTSGHGFKFGPLLGSVLADLAAGVPPRWDLAAFRMNRRAVTAG
jgi:sarcosine oxidase